MQAHAPRLKRAGGFASLYVAAAYLVLNLVLDTDDGGGIVIKESDEVDGSC